MQKHPGAPPVKDRQGFACHVPLTRRRAAHGTAVLGRAVAGGQRLRQILRRRDV